MTRNKILKAQQMLRKLGSAVQVTGVWSIGMKSAIRSFQKKYGLEITGELDKKTWKKLNKEAGTRRFWFF